MAMSVKMDEKEAKAIMLASNLKPLEPYPGGAKPWKCKCLKCGKTVTPRLKLIKNGVGGCKYCGRVKAGLSWPLCAEAVATSHRDFGRLTILLSQRFHIFHDRTWCFCRVFALEVTNIEC